MEKNKIEQKLFNLIGYLNKNQNQKSMIVELKRLNEENYYKSFYFWACIQVIAPEDDLSDKELRIWLLLIPMIAALEYFDFVEKEKLVPYGKILAESSLSEYRFLQLINANGEQLIDRIRSTIPFIKGHTSINSMNWLDLVYLLLTDETDIEDRSRKMLAKDYYAVILNQPSKS